MLNVKVRGGDLRLHFQMVTPPGRQSSCYLQTNLDPQWVDPQEAAEMIGYVTCPYQP